MRAGKVWWHTSVGMKLSSFFLEFLQLTSSGTRYSAMLCWKCFTVSQEITILLSLVTRNTPDLGLSVAFYHTVTNRQRMEFATTSLILFSVPTTFDWAITFFSTSCYPDTWTTFSLLCDITCLTIVGSQYKTTDIFLYYLILIMWLHVQPMLQPMTTHWKVLVRKEVMTSNQSPNLVGTVVWLLCGRNLAHQQSAGKWWWKAKSRVSYRILSWGETGW